MKEMDYVIMGAGRHRTIAPRTNRARERTPETKEFPDVEGALEFVRTGVDAGFRFSGRELVDPEYRLVRYRYFVKDNDGQIVPAGQDYGPPDPVFEAGDIYPGGPRNGRRAIVSQVITGEHANNGRCGVMVVLEEHEIDASAN